MAAPPSARSLLLLLLLSWAAALGCTGKTPEPASGATEPAGAPAPDDRPFEATVARVQGPGGLASSRLPAGAFLGAGAALPPDATYTTGPDTLVELATPGGAALRLDAGTRVRIDRDGRWTVEAGRIFFDVPDEHEPLAVRAGGDRFVVERGQAQAERRGGTGRYLVVFGHAVLETGGERIDLGPGADLTTPLAEAPSQRPLRTIAPLERTTWAMVFDEARRLSEQAPAGIGSLSARRPGTNHRFEALAIDEQKVFVSITGRVAVTTVEQTFRNDRNERLEGQYVFPIPAGASIAGLELLVGDTWRKADIVEKVRARRIYRAIVDAVVPRDPALLEWRHGSLFKMRIFPIPPRGTRKVRLSYAETLPVLGDTLAYRYPFGGSDAGAGGTRIGRFTFEARLDGHAVPGGAEAVRPRMLDAPVEAAGPDLVVRTEATDFAPAHPIGLDLPAPPMDAGAFAQAGPGPDGRTYLLATVRPDLSAPAERVPTDYVFVFDRSHGTAPALFTAARGIFEAVARDLPAPDRVAVIACDTACDTAPGALAPLGPDRLDRILSFLDAQVLAGASDLGQMIRTAGELVEGTGRRAVVVYLGDGAATSGELALDELLRRQADVLARVELHAVALGSRSDLLALSALARRTGGSVVPAGPSGDLGRAVRALATRTAVPALRNARVRFPPGVVDVYPKGPVAVRPGETLTFVARLAPNAPPPAGALRLAGTASDGTPVAVELPLHLDRPAPVGGTIGAPAWTGAPATATPALAGARIAHLWARHAIDERTAAEGYAARDAIVALSKTYHVISRYTALLVLENEAMARRFGLRRTKRKRWRRRRTRTRAPASNLPIEPFEPEVSSAPAPKARRSRSSGRPPARPGPPPATPFSSGADGRWAETEKAASGPTADAAGLDGAGGPLRYDEPPPPVPPEQTIPVPSVGSGEAWPGLARRGRALPRPVVEPPDAVFPRLRAKVKRLEAAVAADPTRRKAHRALVRGAIAAGHPRAVAFARAWVERDPDFPEAVAALADALVQAGDPLAHRVRAGIFEARPFDRTGHWRMARVLGARGDFVRACSHLRAVVSIDPTDVAGWRALAGCLVRAGRIDRARAIVGEARSRPALDHESARRDRRIKATLDQLDATLHQEPDRVRSDLDFVPFPPDRLRGRWTVQVATASGPAPEILVVGEDGTVDGTCWPHRTWIGEEPARRTVAVSRGYAFVEISNPSDRPLRATVRIEGTRRPATFPVDLAPGQARRLAHIR